MDITISRPDSHFTLRAAALIIDDDRLLSVEHIPTGSCYTIGGRIRVGESSAEAAVREAFEETGHRFEIDRLMFVNEGFFTHDGRSHHEVCFFYLMKPNGAVISSGERTDQVSERLVWLPNAELPTLPLVPHFLRTALQTLPDAPVHLISQT